MSQVTRRAVAVVAGAVVVATSGLLLQDSDAPSSGALGRPSSVAHPVEVPEANELPLIEANRWDWPEASGGFDVVTELEPLEPSADGPALEYLGRVEESFYFRGANSELIALPLSAGTPRTVGQSAQTAAPARRTVGHGVKAGSSIAGDASGVYWATPNCTVYTTPHRRLGACIGRLNALAVDREHVYMVATTVSDSGPVQDALWRLPRRGGTASKQVVLAPSVSPYYDPLFDGDAFYYSGDRRSLYRLPLNGERARVVARESAEHIIDELQFADSSALYWTDRSATGHLQAQERLIRMSKDGSAVEVVAWSGGRFAAFESSLYWFDTNLQHLYVATHGGPWRHLSHLPVDRAELHPFRGGALVFDGDLLLRVRADSARPRRIHERSAPHQYLTAHEGTLYFIADNAELRDWPFTELWRMSATGGSPKRLLRAAFWSAPAIDGDFVYLLGEGERLERVPLAGGAKQALVEERDLARFGRQRALQGLNPAEDYVQLVTIDDSHVYFVTPQRGAVLVVPKIGGRPKVLAIGRDAPVALALDATHVYYATTNAESQSRIARIDKRGGSPAVTLTRFEGVPARLAVSEEDIVWTVDGWLYRIGKAGGVASLLRQNVCDLALHGRTLIYTQCGENGRVFRFDLRTRRLSALATSLSGPRHPVVEGENMYWITTGSEVGMRSPTLIRCCAVWTMPF